MMAPATKKGIDDSSRLRANSRAKVVYAIGMNLNVETLEQRPHRRLLVPYGRRRAGFCALSAIYRSDPIGAPNFEVRLNRERWIDEAVL
jgi:hypothetical protein